MHPLHVEPTFPELLVALKQLTVYQVGPAVYG